MISSLLEGNQRYVREVFSKDQEFFSRIAKGQNPTVLWIGCSDSRVPANTITQARAGEIFTHRNVANIVATNDWNLSAVLEFSINHLQIPDIVICGHYGCGGIEALDIVSRNDQYIPVWLINARKAKERVDQRLTDNRLALDREARLRLYVEENVRLQLEHLQEYPFVQTAILASKLAIHGWIYDMETGAIRVLDQQIGKHG